MPDAIDRNDHAPAPAGAATDPARTDPTDPVAGPEGGAGPHAGTGRDDGAGPPSDPGWREPAWFPPRERHRERRTGPVGIVIGLAFVAFGAYEFLDRTLGLNLPRIPWSSLWPLGLIVIGGLILVRSLERRR